MFDLWQSNPEDLTLGVWLTTTVKSLYYTVIKWILKPRLPKLAFIWFDWFLSTKQTCWSISSDFIFLVDNIWITQINQENINVSEDCSQYVNWL